MIVIEFYVVAFWPIGNFANILDRQIALIRALCIEGGVMNSFEQTRKTLLSLSLEKSSYEHALTEWQYFGTLYDNGVACSNCGLCGQQDIRYELEIINQQNGKILLVGSECITKFRVKVYDRYGKQLIGSEAKAKVNSDKRRLIADAKTRSVINSLVMLASKDKEFDINSFIGYYRERGAFTPKQLSLLLWRLDKFEVQVDKSHFKVSIRKDREKRQLLDFPDWQKAKVQDCLSSAQRDWVKRNSNP